MFKKILSSLFNKKNHKEKLLDFLKKHLKKVSDLNNNINKIKEERQRFNQEILFSSILREFVNEIKYYPTWIKENKLNGSERFKENFLKKNKISSNEYISKFKMVINKNDYNDNDDIVEFKFESNNKKYDLYFNKSFKRYSYNGDSYYYSILILENNEKIVADIDLIYQDDRYSEYYESSCLNAFKPNERTIELLIIMIKLINEKKMEREISINKMMEENNRKNFTD